MTPPSRASGTASDRARATGEDGQVLMMILGYAIIALCLVVVAVDATAVYLARTQLLDASDAAALDAGDAVDSGSAFTGGVHGHVPLSTDTVTAAARRYLTTYTAPDRIDDVQLAAGTGTNDGVTAVVVLSAHVRLPLFAPVVDAWSGGVTVTVRSQARADVDP